jgi:hypothetical protein
MSKSKTTTSKTTVYHSTVAEFTDADLRRADIALTVYRSWNEAKSKGAKLVKTQLVVDAELFLRQFLGVNI